MVLPFSPLPCSITSTCRDRANAEPDIAFKQGGLGLVWSTAVLQKLLGILLSLYMPWWTLSGVCGSWAR